jgi:hypothetical protein
VGYVATGFVVFVSFIQYVVGLVKRSIEAPA